MPSPVGWGYHRRFGGPHAEVEAIRRAGNAARGATCYITLEPCNHSGKTGPCTDALIEAGIARVVIARRDPHPIAAGGLERLKARGIAVELIPDVEPATSVSDPFAWRESTGLPWVIAKWAQTIDGRLATRRGDSKWISSERSRKMVHRERGRVDAILTGIGTVRNDDPLLTARGVRVRRVARRVVIDPALEIPLEARIVQTAGETPTLVVCDDDAVEKHRDRARALETLGVMILGVRGDGGEIALNVVLRHLVDNYDATNVLVESGPGVLSRLLTGDLVREAWVFIGPHVLADDEALPVATGAQPPTIAAGLPLSLRSVRRRDDDVVLRYRTACAGKLASSPHSVSKPKSLGRSGS